MNAVQIVARLTTAPASRSGVALRSDGCASRSSVSTARTVRTAAPTSST